MTATLSGNGISSATARFHRTGAWAAGDVVLVDSGVTTLAEGQRILLVVGDVQAVGTLRSGGEFGGTATWTAVGGAGRWDTQIGRRFYDDTDGVLLSRVVRDLAVDAGELGAVLGIADRSLGQRWERPAGLASVMLQALSGGEWWIATDRADPATGVITNTTLANGTAVLSGWTVVGPRPASNVVVGGITAQPYDPALRRAVVASEDESFWQLMPGATLALDGLPSPLLIGSAIFCVTSGQTAVELYGEKAIPELLADFVAARTALARLLGAYPFTTTGAGTSPGVMPANALSADFPGPPSVPQWPGLPGVTATLAAGAGVLVTFLGGDAGAPAIVGYAAGVVPTSLALDATTHVDICGTAPLVVDTGGAFTAWLATVFTALAAAGHPVSAPPTIAAVKARGG